MMEKWPIGVFTSVDAGLGVKLEVARDLGVPTIQLHAPAKETRTSRRRLWLALAVAAACAAGWLVLAQLDARG